MSFAINMRSSSSSCREQRYRGDKTFRRKLFTNHSNYKIGFPIL